MSHAFKCDRCGKFSEGGCHFGLRTEGRKLPLYDGEIDCCAECEADFERWVKREPTQVLQTKPAVPESEVPEFLRCKKGPNHCDLLAGHFGYCAQMRTWGGHTKC